MPLRFAGQYADDETGLYYNYFRFYDPKTGRYVENDPIDLTGGLNRWGYVGGSPLLATDPKGLFLPAIPVAIAIGEAIGAGVAAIINAAPVAAAVGVGVVAMSIPSDTPKDDTDKKTCSSDNCPPCSPYPVGTIGYQGSEVHKTGRDAGMSHFHLFEVQQIRTTCECIWKERTKSIAGDHHYYYQPNFAFAINLNGKGRPPSYP